METLRSPRGPIKVVEVIIPTKQGGVACWLNRTSPLRLPKSVKTLVARQKRLPLLTSSPLFRGGLEGGKPLLDLGFER